MFNLFKRKKKEPKVKIIQIQLKDCEISGYSIFSDLCRKLNDIYSQYDVINREDSFLPAKLIDVKIVDGFESLKTYSAPSIEVTLKCAPKKEKNVYRNIYVYEYGNGTYAEPFKERYEKKIAEIEEKYDILHTFENYIPPHLCDVTYYDDEMHKTHQGPTICTYIFAKLKEDC